MPGKLLVVSGPSGVGKGTVLARVLKRFPHLRKSVSVTTRPPAPGEVPGDEYRFVGDEEFSKLVEEGAFVEWAEVHGHRYGTPEAWVDEQLAKGVDVVLEIDVQGGLQIAAQRPAACLIFISPPSMEELDRRIRSRGRDPEADVKRRLRETAHEMELSSHYHYQVVNDELDRAVDELSGILTAERGRRTEP